MMIMTMITLKMEIYVCLSVGLLFEHRQYKEQRAHTYICIPRQTTTNLLYQLITMEIE